MSGIIQATNLQVDNIKSSGGTSAMTIDSAGQVFHPNKISFKVHLTSNQSVTHQTWTYLNFNDVANGWNIGGKWDTSNTKFLPAVAGYYHIGASAVVAATGASYLQLRFEKNNSTSMNVFSGVESGDTSTWHYAHGSSVIYLDSDDYIRFKVYHNDSEARNIVEANDYTQAWGFLLA